MKKEFNVIYVFSEVCDVIEANNRDEAEEIASDRLTSDLSPKNDTECYKIEIEEV